MSQLFEKSLILLKSKWKLSHSRLRIAKLPFAFTGISILFRIVLGSPRGIKIAEITSRIVKAVLIPRNRLIEAGQREETKGVGVYFLFGQSDDDAKPSVYIGEAEDCYTRLKQHHKEKDFWETAVVITTSNNTFTKAHIKYLEWFCFEQCKVIGRYKMQQTIPTKSYIPEHVIADLMDMFDTLKILLATLGYNIFEEIRDASGNRSVSKESIFYCRGKGIEASGEFTDEGFVVFKNSQMAAETAPSMKTYLELRNKLILDGLVVKKDAVYILQSDYVFKSPSAASGVILGRPSNGWTDWKDRDGRTLDEIKRKSV
ncbi:GIY-YIG nuclease family protein [Paenibacillus rhizovicinus]|uniref:GIY-YIG nuclease family protein n=1 Tax=Paenibacillus rhizovicinus TaxID=2704463 RepID=A0A6C0P464_9BACL|nr:GIY-YIG nuclease family protein [Paenibacillus rhizovicinus]QHW31462.1 GIY-YIG nuclease family protein [Paenibacillus rhizovicinus]